MVAKAAIVQMSKRGQVTLPAEVRRSVQARGGDTFLVHVEDGRIVLDPAVVLPVERYSDERIAEFAEATGMTRAETARARKRWLG